MKQFMIELSTIDGNLQTIQIDEIKSDYIARMMNLPEDHFLVDVML